MLGRQGHRVLGPSLAQPWNACSHDQTRRGSISLGWIMFGLEAGPRLSQAIASVGVQPPLTLPTSWAATLEWEEGEKEVSGLEHELNPSQK